MTNRQLQLQLKNKHQKKCSKCKKFKIISEFYISEYSPGKFRTQSPCKKCSRETIRSDEYKNNQRNRILKNKFNISLEDYNILLKNQNNKCAICFKDISDFKKQLAVDHDHETGIVRGLLCINCNNGLGQFKDDKMLLQRAIKYLN